MARPNQLPKVLTPEEKQALLNQFNTRYKTPHRNLCMVRLMLEAGPRASEVVSIKPEHLDMMTFKLVIREGKNLKDRTLWINEDLRDLIGEWVQRRPDSQWLFPTRNGKQVHRTNLTKIVKREAKNAEIAEWEKVSAHTLRHTFATELLRERKNLRIVQKALGHADISTTQIYTHIVDEELEEAMKGFPVVGNSV